jgi:ribonuclease HI
MGIQRIVIKTDSQIVTGHIKKDYKARDLELARYLQFLRDQEKYFEGFTVKNISRNDNLDADELAKAVSHPFNDQMECILLCVPRDQSHIS